MYMICKYDSYDINRYILSNIWSLHYNTLLWSKFRGFKDIRIVDGDESVVNLLKKRYNNSKAGIVVQQCQIEKGIPLDDKQRFHIAIDKGLLDGLLCSPTGRSTAEAAVAEVWDTLRTPGTWISVSHSCPYERLPIYRVKYWDSIKVFTVRSLGPEDINLDRTEERKLTPFPENLFDQSQPFDPAIAYVYTFVKWDKKILATTLASKIYQPP